MCACARKTHQEPLHRVQWSKSKVLKRVVSLSHMKGQTMAYRLAALEEVFADLDTYTLPKYLMFEVFL
jgi:hypothetical protein